MILFIEQKEIDSVRDIDRREMVKLSHGLAVSVYETAEGGQTGLYPSKTVIVLGECHE